MTAKSKLIEASAKSKQRVAELHKERSDLDDSIKNAKKKESEIVWELAKFEATVLFKELDQFSELFSSGVVRKGFDNIKGILSNLSEYDSKYINALSSGDPYGSIKGTPEVRFLVSYLLGGVWKKDADLWSVLAQVADTKSVESNPFVVKK